MFKNGQKSLCPTPGLGSEASMNSYDFTEHAEKLRVMVGRAGWVNREAIGLTALNVFILGSLESTQKLGVEEKRVH